MAALTRIICLFVLTTSLFFGCEGGSEDGGPGGRGIGGQAGEGGSGGIQPPSAGFASATVSSAGGEYLLDNGIRLTVPPGAVEADTELSLRLVPEGELTSILHVQAQTDKTVLAAVQTKHPGASFAKPVTVSLPFTGTYPPSALPSLIVVDLVNEIYTFDTSAIPESIAQKVVPNPATKYVQFDCENNLVIIANISKLPEDERVLVAAGIHELRKESDCFYEPCRCCQIRAQEETLDVVRESTGGETNCFNSVIEGSVQYLSCEGQLTEAYKIVETSVNALRLNPEALELHVAAVAVVSVDVLDANGDEIEFYTIRTVDSSNEEVATAGSIELDADRFQVTGHSPGTATLTVIFDCSIKAELEVTVLPIEVLTDRDDVIVPEEGGASFQARLNGPPPGDSEILLGVQHSGGDTDISVTPNALLIFDASNWSQYQSVSLAAEKDADADNGVATISLSSASTLVKERTVSVREADNDVLQLVPSSGRVFIQEGRTAPFTVRLSNEPPGDVSVSVAHVFGDTDISVQSGGSLSFTPSDWEQAQTVMLRAAEDDDDVDNGAATIRVSDGAAVIPSVDLEAVEIDNDSVQLFILPGSLCVERNQTGNLSVIASTAVDFATLQWVSSDETVATVDETGVVTASEQGPARIMAMVDGATAFATVSVREHCVTIEPPSTCLHAPISAQETISTSLEKLIPTIETAQTGHRIRYESSNDTVVKVDSTGLVEALGEGTADIRVSVDNVVADYEIEVPIYVAGGLDEYKASGVNLSWGPQPQQKLFLTDDREIFHYDEVLQRVNEFATDCGSFPEAPDVFVVTDFNDVGEYIGYYAAQHFGDPLVPYTNGLYFDAVDCVFSYLDMEDPVAINDEGLIGGQIETEDENGDLRDTEAYLMYPSGAYGFPFPAATDPDDESETHILDINNEGEILGWVRAGLAAQDFIRYGPDSYSAIFGASTPGVLLEAPVTRAMNDHAVVAGSTYEGDDYFGFLFFEAEYYYPPPEFADGMNPLRYAFDGINNEQDILAHGSNFEPFVMHICPFSLATNVCSWIEDKSAIEGYEAYELTCDGFDNDCDGAVDESLIAIPSAKQRGVCLGAVDTCRGGLGWMPDYDDVANYEFPEVSCDDLDNDCDGETDEGIDADGDGHFGVPLCSEPPDCDDRDPAVYPGATESCNDVDDDCDTVIDNDCAQ